MLDGFGLTPVTLQLDLDSYDGPWTHVQRFRGRSGWLVVAEAHLTAEATAWVTTLVAACDEWGEAVPGFMAPNLLACACSLPQPCHEFPPEELDAILEEEEGALVARWLRETDAELGTLHEGTARHIADLEARTRVSVATGERQVAELRRRRRSTAPADPAREIIDAVILAIEAEADAANERMTAERRVLRLAAEAREEALLATTAVDVEVVPLFHIHWHGAAKQDETRELVEHLGAGAEWGRGGLRTRLPENTGCPSPLAGPPSKDRTVVSEHRARRMEAELGWLTERAATLRCRMESTPLLARDRRMLRHQSDAVQAALDQTRRRREHSQEKRD